MNLLKDQESIVDETSAILKNFINFNRKMPMKKGTLGNNSYIFQFVGSGQEADNSHFQNFTGKGKKLMYSVKNSGARVLINILTQNMIPLHMLSLIRENNS